MADLDCTLYPETCSRQHIKGYPTLRLFQNNHQTVDYERDRSVADLTEFATSVLADERADFGLRGTAKVLDTKAWVGTEVTGDIEQ